MSNHAESKGPKVAVSGLGRSTTARVPEPDVASQRPRLRWERPAFVGDVREGTRLKGYDDLIAGAIAVAALLAMMALDLTPWLAIPLSVVTYVAVTLLRPGRETVIAAVEHPGIRVSGEIHEPVHFPDGGLIGANAVATRFKLTRRELEILPLLAQRLTDREIAEQLSISHRTAMNHTANILGKLGLASRRDVAAFVAQYALLPASVPPHEIE